MTTADIAYSVACTKSNEDYFSEKTSTFSQVEFVGFYNLQSDLRDAILDFLSPLKIGYTKSSNGHTSTT